MSQPVAPVAPVAPVTEPPAPTTPPAPPAPPEPVAPAAPAPVPPTPATLPPVPAATPPAPGANLPDDPEALKAMIQSLRSENAKSRTDAKTSAADEARQSLAQQIGKALGLVADDAPVDPAQLVETNRSQSVQLAVFKAAPQGVKVNELLDSMSFNNAVSQLDPASPDFSSQVQEAIKAAVAANPSLKAGQAPARSGNQLTGGTGGAEQITEAQLASMTPEQTTKAYAEGRLSGLLSSTK